MKIIYNRILPPAGFAAINICGILFVRNRYKPLKDYVIRHESIHTRQIIELLAVFFYLWYGIEWLVRFIRYRNTHTAYRNISFEREAYANQYDINYLTSRKWYGFIRYLSRIEDG